jgi:hypothetical protein
MVPNYQLLFLLIAHGLSGEVPPAAIEAIDIGEARPMDTTPSKFQVAGAELGWIRSAGGSQSASLPLL